MIITLLLYTTFILGLYAQIILGAFQILTGIVLLFFIKNFSKENKNRLSIYWCLTIGYGLTWLTSLLDFLDSLWVVLLIILPLSIASYFTFILESIKKEI